MTDNYLLKYSLPTCKCGESEWVTVRELRCFSIVRCLWCDKTMKTRCSNRHEIPKENESARAKIDD